MGERTKTTYDENVIQEFADRLCEQAEALIQRYARYGFLIGLVIGGGALGSMSSAGQDVGWLGIGGVVVVAVVGSWVMSGIGREKGFVLRLQAQQALCQLQIERNTRPSPTP